MQDNRRALIAAAILSALITFIIYLPALVNGFVNWDDPRYVFENPWIQKLDLAFLKRAFTEVYFANWHPLTMISYAVDYAIWGLNPLGYHLLNNVIHSVNTALVAVLTIRLISVARPLSPPSVFVAGFVPALLFGIHPLHVESVAWVSERKDVLCALFFIGSVIFYLRYAQQKKKLCYALSLVSFALAIMSKSMAVTLPAVLLLIDFYPLKRLSSLKGVLTAVAEKLPFFAICAFASIMAVYSQSSAMASLEAIPFDIRLFSALRSYAFYLEKLFVPIGLAPFYPYPADIDPLSADYLVTYGVLGGITLICLAAIRYRVFIVTWLYFLGTLLPVIGLVQVGMQSAADRYMYLPSLSLLVLLGAGAALIIEKELKPLLAIFLGFVSIATVALSYATVTQAAIWKDSVALWDYGIERYPDAYIPHINRGVAFVRAGDFEKGMKDLDRAVELNRFSRSALYNRALALKTMGRYAEALADLDAAISIKPMTDYYNNRGNVKKRLGDLNGAVSDYRSSLELEQRPETYFNLALVLEEAGDMDGAMRSAQKASELGFRKAVEYLDYLKGRARIPAQNAQ
ncbi:MAG: tetratricopeptide repeat protein [Deltaproteobacteria bacterium]|nr:tetratricopeptide repeat protein [Deltaproteobacteria bacterium]